MRMFLDVCARLMRKPVAKSTPSEGSALIDKLVAEMVAYEERRERIAEMAPVVEKMLAYDRPAEAPVQERTGEPGMHSTGLAEGDSFYFWEVMVK